ncbi:fibropellin-1 [Patella vulgata]|uniref:fibropellin-1 n=1 Tax=Patella vulgata TaxID=6465 RepID=UPI00217F93DA|nr:fibropellin-1 [Patella vulgata]
MRGLLVAVLVVATVSTGHSHRRRYWRRRPAFNLESVSCDTFKRADLCNCCKDPCDDVECLNNGVCVNGICNCPCGFSGADCGVDLCATKLCQNNGTCVSEAGGVSCKCEDGFTGDNCEVDLCVAETCQNNGTCVPEAGGVSCICVAGFTGDFCEKDVCEPNPCQYDGTCSRIEGGFNCSCIDRITGPTCEVIDNIITSPNYPNNYLADISFVINIPGVSGKQIRIAFDGDFEIQKTAAPGCDQGSSGTTNCQDSLDIFTQSLRYTFCGGTAPTPITATEGDVQVEFAENDDLTQCKGFNLSYTYVDV